MAGCVATIGPHCALLRHRLVLIQHWCGTSLETKRAYLKKRFYNKSSSPKSASTAAKTTNKTKRCVSWRRTLMYGRSNPELPGCGRYSARPWNPKRIDNTSKRRLMKCTHEALKPWALYLQPDALALAGAQLLGTCVIRYILRLEPIASMPRDELVNSLVPAVQYLLTTQPTNTERLDGQDA